MSSPQKNQVHTHPVISLRATSTASTDTLHHLAFENSIQANIITIASTGRIISVNSAACKLLGYSKADLVTKTRAIIFDVTEDSFRQLLEQRNTEGQSSANVTAVKKNGSKFPADITTAVFTGADGIENAIFTIVDLSPAIRKQKRIDTKREKQVADDIHIAQSKSDVRLAENNEWIKYIAKTSYDVMWDWDIASGEIYVGDSIEEVFGYRTKNNKVHFRAFGRCLLPGEKNTVEKKLFSVLASGAKSWKDNYMFQRRDGAAAATISRASIVRDEEGKAIRMIGATQDISKQKELETKLTEQVSIQEEHKSLLEARLSFDVIWDWNLLTNEMFIGEEFEPLFGYIIKNNRGKIADKINHLHAGDREDFEEGLKEAIASAAKQWEYTYRFTRADGSIARIFDKASIIRHADGKAYRMIGSMQDLSRQKELEEKLNHQAAVKEKLLTEYQENFKLLFNASADTLFDFDIAANQVSISNAYQKEFGYPITGNMTPEEDWISHIHPDDKDAVMQDYLRVLSSGETEWNYKYRFLKADHSAVNVLSRAILIRNAAGKAYRMIGYIHDISKQIVLKARLKKEIESKEKQISDAMEDARQTERSALGRELHDNVNQLLSVSKLYVDMAKRGEANSEMYLNQSSEYTLMAIEEIRKLSKKLTTVTVKTLGLKEAIQNICHDTMEIGKVHISFTPGGFMEETWNDNFKLAVFRIVQEQLTNILKHAGASEVTIALSQDKKLIQLIIADNGAGFDTAKEFEGIGMANIKSRAAAFNGTAAFISEQGKGCHLSVSFPVKDILIKQTSLPELTTGKQKMLVEKAKEVIVTLLQDADERRRTNFSVYLGKQLACDYNYLSKIFTELEGNSIQQFILSQKIERVKKLLIRQEFNLTEIAWKLDYSSVAHLSNQFKKITGLTPSQYKMQYK